MKVLVGFLTETAFCCALLYGIGFSSNTSSSSGNNIRPRENLDLKRDQADGAFIVSALEQCYAITEVAKVGIIVSRSPAITREAERILRDYAVVIDSLKAVAAQKNLCMVLGPSESHRTYVTALHAETPESFDGAWRSAVATMNMELMQQFETYPHPPDEVLQLLFTTSLPILRQGDNTFKTLIAEEQADQ